VLHTAVNGAWCLCRDGQFTLTATVDPPLRRGLTWINRELVPLPIDQADHVASQGGHPVPSTEARDLAISELVAKLRPDQRVLDDPDAAVLGHG
jgi:hypothetical protein